MAIRLRQKQAIVRQIAEFFVKSGKVPADRREYGEMEGAPIRVPQLSCYFGAWGALLDAIRKQEPELWDKATTAKTPTPQKAAPKPAPKPTEAKPKPAPAKVAPKPAATSVVKEEK